MTKTESIFKANKCPWNHSSQGNDLRVLFVCSAGLLRSPTAARMYAHKYNTRSAGSNPDYALIPVNENLLRWANRIVFMKRENKTEVEKYFNLDDWFHKSEITVLDVPDEYDHMNPILQSIIEMQFERLNDD